MAVVLNQAFVKSMDGSAQVVGFHILEGVGWVGGGGGTPIGVVGCKVVILL
jgi:hypothetical protein